MLFLQRMNHRSSQSVNQSAHFPDWNTPLPAHFHKWAHQQDSQPPRVQILDGRKLQARTLALTFNFLVSHTRSPESQRFLTAQQSRWRSGLVSFFPSSSQQNLQQLSGYLERYKFTEGYLAVIKPISSLHGRWFVYTLWNASQVLARVLSFV